MATRQLGSLPSSASDTVSKGYVDAALWAPRLLRANFPATTNVGTTAVRIYDKTWATAPAGLPADAQFYKMFADASIVAIPSAANGGRGALQIAISNPAQTVTHVRSEDVLATTTTTGSTRHITASALIPVAEGCRVVVSLLQRGSGTIRIAGDPLTDNLQVIMTPGLELL